MKEGKHRYHLTKAPVLGVEYAAGDRKSAAAYVLHLRKKLAGKYICFSNVHTTVMANKDEAYRKSLNGAAFVFPDGKPVAWVQKANGMKRAERIAGPDFMATLFRATKDGRATHYFYGASEETLRRLRNRLVRKYPGIRIVGMYSPPYRELSGEEEARDIERIKNSGADFVWIGLGAPKQEQWMNRHAGELDAVMFGVGAGFDFHAGTVKRAQGWVQRIGMEWFYRLLQDPKRLLSRYLVTNTLFVWYLMKQHTKRR